MNSIFKYKENNGEVIITGLQEGVAETAIVIPETIGNMPVVEIGPKAFEFSTITDIKIGKNIRKIEKEAFAHCRKLSSVTWNCKCNTIPDNCFYRCTELKKFDFTAIKRVGQYAFGESGLQEVYIPQNIEMIGIGAFNICSELHSVTWNCKCDVIPADCFYECTNLKQFDFSGIEKIGKHAFEGSGLQEVNLPENINVVLVGAFERCGELQSATWSHKCELIPSNCFEGCLKLTKFNFANAKRIGQSAFRNSGLQEVRLAKNIKNVYDSAFYECRKLQFVEWNCQRDVIPDTCFARCSSLKEFDLSNVRKIEERAFIYSGLTSVTLSTGTAVGHGCFACCNDLEKVEWLSDESIEKNIFAECKNIKEILISDKVMNIAVGAFAASPNAEISFV